MQRNCEKSKYAKIVIFGHRGRQIVFSVSNQKEKYNNTTKWKHLLCAITHGQNLENITFFLKVRMKKT